MKIVHIASGDLWAGAEKQLLSLACALRDLPDTDIETVILNVGTLAERLRAEAIPTTVLDETRLGGRELLRQLSAHLKQCKPDIVHTHRIKENILGAVAARLAGAASLRTQHGAQEHPPAWHDLRRQGLIAANWLAGRLLQRRVVAVSDLLARQLARAYGASHVVTIANGLEPGAPPVPRDWRRRDWRIGIVGRLVPVKRVDLFLAMATQLARAYPERQLSFWVIGDGPLRATLEHQAAAMAAPVQFTGHVDGAETAIAELDLLVLCSDHEGLPMVALEAMKAGTVLVSHRIGALPELLDDGRCGVIVPEQSAGAFAKAIGELLTDPDTAAGMSGAARERLERHFSSRAMAKRYRALYDEIAGC